MFEANLRNQSKRMNHSTSDFRFPFLWFDSIPLDSIRFQRAPMGSSGLQWAPFGPIRADSVAEFVVVAGCLLARRGSASRSNWEPNVSVSGFDCVTRNDYDSSGMIDSLGRQKENSPLSPRCTRLGAIRLVAM